MTTTLKGSWHYQSYLVLPSPSEQAAPPGSAVTARKWATGTLTVPTETDQEVEGELVFGPGTTLSVKGNLRPATDSSPAILVAVGEALNGGLVGSVYRIAGAVFEQANSQQSIYGSVLAARGPDADPGMAGGVPINTVGTFVLSRPAESE